MKTYVLGEKTKQNLDRLIADNIVDLTSAGTGRKGGISRGGGNNRYTGPFAVVKKDDTTVKVRTRHDDVTYFEDSLIISGLTSATRAGSAYYEVTVTVDGWIYVDVYAFNYIYNCVFSNAATVPAQTTSHLYIPLARVIFADSKITKIIQVHEGQIYPTKYGRSGG